MLSFASSFAGGASSFSSHVDDDRSKSFWVARRRKRAIPPSSPEVWKNGQKTFSSLKKVGVVNPAISSSCSSCSRSAAKSSIVINRDDGAAFAFKCHRRGICIAAVSGDDGVLVPASRRRRIRASSSVQVFAASSENAHRAGAATTSSIGGSDNNNSKLSFDVHALKHFCVLGAFFTGLLYVAYALLPHVGYTAAHPPHTENLMVKTFQSLSTMQAAEWLRFIDLFGTGVFAHGGVIAAGKRGLDLLGCIVVGCVTAMGGGTIRGALIGIEGAHPVFWIAEPEYLIVALVASLFTFFFWPKVLSKEVRESKPMETALNWLDAISLGGFCIIGANAALVRNLGPLLAVALSAITCTGGGVVRDVFLRQPVRVLHSHAELYGTTAIAGATVYTIFACWFPGVSHNLRCLLAASTTVFLRWSAWKRGLKLPMYADVNPEGDYIQIAQRDV